MKNFFNQSQPIDGRWSMAVGRYLFGNTIVRSAIRQRPSGIFTRSRIILMLIILCVATSLPAQRNEELSNHELFQSLVGSPEDSNKVDKLRELAEYYIGLKNDTSLLLAKQAFDLSEKIKYEKGKIKSQFTMGKVFVFMGNYTRGLELYLESLEISEQIDDIEWTATNLSYIGEVYGYQADYQQSLSYFFKGKSIADQNHLNTTLARILLNIGKTYENLGRLDSANFYTRKSYELVKQFKDDYLLGKILYSLGALYAKTGEPDKAMEFYRLSIAESEKVQDYAITCNASLGMATLFARLGNMDSSLYYAMQSLTIARQSDFLLQQLNADTFLAQYFKKRKQYDSAFVYLEISVALKDSLLSKEKITAFQQISFSEQFRQQEIQQAAVQYRSKVKMLILLGGVSALLVLAIVLWRNIRLKQKANILLTAQKAEIDKQKDKIEASYRELKLTQKQLIQSEKMASLGELTAGIAHEIQNPLNFVNNFSEVNAELINEMEQEIARGNLEDVKAIAKDIKENEQRINHHGKRADSILKGMLQHSRSGSGQKEPTDINALADEYLRLAYHGLRAKDSAFNAKMTINPDKSMDKISIVRQDIGRVLLNLMNNAFYAVNEKKKLLAIDLTGLPNLLGLDAYEPTVSISTKKINYPPAGGVGGIEISIRDNGNGIPQKILNKIFQPFFTTKPTGQGTGLGLSLSYDIIKAHGGELRVETKEGEFAEFIIELPV